ncbi:MAG TPA: hypothetical protein V6D33_12500 [Cyanophyceae cyanobacterium]
MTEYLDHIEVIYDRDLPGSDKKESVIIRRVPRSRRSELKSLLAKLLAEFLYFGQSRGELCDSENERVWADLGKVAQMLPLDGGGVLNLDRVDDWQIIELFFVDEVTEVRGRIVMDKADDGLNHYTPGKIARLHGINFLDYHDRCLGIYGIAVEMFQERIQRDREEKMKEREQEVKNQLSLLEPTEPSQLEPVEASEKVAMKTP